jgi:hypothetical protein
MLAPRFEGREVLFGFVVFLEKAADLKCGGPRYDCSVGPGVLDPLTRPAPADEDAGSVHPLPQGGEGS